MIADRSSAVKGSLRRLAPWIAAGRSEGMAVYEGKRVAPTLVLKYNIRAVRVLGSARSDLAGLDEARIFNLMYELQTIQRPSASLLIGARAR